MDSSTPLISAFFGGMRSNSGAMNEMGDARSVGTGREENRARIGQLDNRGVIQVQGGTGGVGGGAEDPGARRNVRINVMDDGVRGMNASRFGLMLLMLVNVPLIVAGVFVLSLHWRDSSECGTRHTSRWRWWALVSVVRMALITPVVAVSLQELRDMLFFPEEKRPSVYRSSGLKQDSSVSISSLVDNSPFTRVEFVYSLSSQCSSDSCDGGKTNLKHACRELSHSPVKKDTVVLPTTGILWEEVAYIICALL